MMIAGRLVQIEGLVGFLSDLCGKKILNAEDAENFAEAAEKPSGEHC